MIDHLLNKIINADCLEVMRGMPDKCVDLVLTDPPYGIGESMGKNRSRGSAAGANKWKGSRNTTGVGVASTDFGFSQWDNEIPSHDYFKEIFRVSRNQIIFGGNYYSEYLRNSSCWIVWDKDNGTTDFADCELAWTSFKSAVRKFKYMWNGMLQENMSEKEIRIHPTQKPVTLFEWILNKYSEPGQIILDPFLGSGTTAAACINLNRQFIGIEISPDYCRLAEERIRRATAQTRMFV